MSDLPETVKQDENSWGLLWTGMNPHWWEKQDQAALAIAVALGLFAGFLLGRAFVEPHGSWDSGGLGCILGVCRTWYWPLVCLWAGTGAVVAAAFVYMTRLLRA